MATYGVSTSDDDDQSEDTEMLHNEIQQDVDDYMTKSRTTRDLLTETVIPAAEMVLIKELEQREIASKYNMAMKKLRSEQTSFSEKLYQSLSPSSILPGQPRAIQLF
jgi:hypothetical protein